MKIKTLRIKNFQSIKDVTFQFDESGVYKLNGKNNIGKSAFTKVFRALVKNVSNNSYKDYLRDGCTFFSIEYVGWDGARVKLSRGSVDYYEWDLGDGRVGRADKTSGKVPAELEEYFNLYHEREKTDEILNIRMEDSRLPFVETTAGDSYFILQKALGTEEFLLATKKAEQLRADEAKSIKLIDTYAKQEEERLAEATRKLADESRKLMEVERYEGVLKAESAIYEELLDISDSLKSLAKDKRALTEVKERIADLPIREVEEGLQVVTELQDMLNTLHEAGRLQAEKRESEQKLKDVDIAKVEGDIEVIEMGQMLLKVMEEVAELEESRQRSLEIVEQVSGCADIEGELTLINELKALLVALDESVTMEESLETAKQREAEALQKLEEFKEEMGVCPVCGTDMSSGAGHTHNKGA